MGRIRSSNDEDAENFHFLMMVQMMATPATHAAMTISTVNVVRVTLVEVDTGAAEGVAEALSVLAGTVMVTLGVERVAGIEIAVGITVGVGVGVCRVEEEEVVEVEDEDDVDVKDVLLELEETGRIELIMLPNGPVVEDDCSKGH